MSNHHFAPGPKAEIEPKGPQHAFEGAVALLAPFKRRLEAHAPADAREAIAAQDPRLLASAEVHSLAEDLNSALYRARQAPRVKDVVAELGRARDLLREANSAIVSLGGWSRFHLRTPSEVYGDGVEPRWLPSYEDGNAGEFVGLASRIADQMDEVVGKLQKVFGDGQIADRGGAQNYEDRFLGPVKNRFIREAFDVFDAYHPGSASSSDGSPFFCFVHKVFEFATGEHDEDKMALGYKLRELISALHGYSRAKAEYWSIELMLDPGDQSDPTRDDLERRQRKAKRQMELHERKLVPALGQKGLPPQKTGK
ncbi:hypothetical protein RX330_02555 [Bradyrhizobium sp. NDS-1]|uniref:hypothetical protein n=1 Tax=Bradyrhizobium sp. NDS-1 TaxID=3080014 RepID=UPI00293F7860|nr:hypothetical protein [Bradyrhizobium sp. NDS-1]WOH74024.1 hypothetical protein RX330_02555 [Bradyrhizobium sp. NDS-1]